jgi:hypothetical protein
LISTFCSLQFLLLIKPVSHISKSHSQTVTKTVFKLRVLIATQIGEIFFGTKIVDLLSTTDTSLSSFKASVVLKLALNNLSSE